MEFGRRTVKRRQRAGLSSIGAPGIARLDLPGFSTIRLDLGRCPEEAGGGEEGPNLDGVSGIRKKYDLDSPMAIDKIDKKERRDNEIVRICWL
jgi:hypothetical protein